MKRIHLTLLLLIYSTLIYSQTGNYLIRGSVSTAANFLNIPADIRGVSMGNLSVANETDANSIFGNPGRLAFSKGLSEIAFTYTPIASGITNDIKMLTLTGNSWIGTNEYVGLSLQYFSLGDVHFFDDQGNETQYLRPNEFALGGFYSRKLTDDFGIGATFKGIFSSLTGGVESGGEKSKKSISIAADFGFKGETELGEGKVTYGLSFNNIGSKISYTNTDKKSFIPMQLKFGSGYRYQLDDDNYLFSGLEFTKPLVPSAPVYDADGNIVAGKDPDRSVVSSIFTSFADSPDGFNGDLKEFGINVGVEGGLANLVFLRAGYFMEPSQNGKNSFASFGVGFYRVFSEKRVCFDTGFLMPTANNKALQNTFKVGISMAILDN